MLRTNLSAKAFRFGDRTGGRKGHHFGALVDFSEFLAEKCGSVMGQEASGNQAFTPLVHLHALLGAQHVLIRSLVTLRIGMLAPEDLAATFDRVRSKLERLLKLLLLGEAESQSLK